MEIKSFNKLVDNPLELSFQDKVLVQEECGKTPYSAVLRLFDTLCSKACNIASDKMNNIHTILLYLPENNMLSSLLGKVRLKDTASVTEPSKPKPQVELPNAEIPQYVATQEELPQECDILKEINDYQEVSFKTAPKSVILDKFLEAAAYRDIDSSPIDPVSVSESGKKSIQPNNSLITETLALILEKQGKYGKAIEVYTNLSNQNPEKSATFAVRIAALRQKVESVQ
jgi:hypothetical protein